MDTKTFLENFGTIAEAPGGVGRLRSTIYEMAVHGLLSGGSVSILETANSVCLPGWSIRPLSEIATYGGFGQELGSNLPESAWMLDLEDIEKSTSRLLAKVRVSERRSSSSKNLFQKNDVLYGKLRPYLDKVLIADEDGYCTSEIIPIRPGDGVCAEWLRICLKSPTFIDYVSSKSYGMKMPRLGTKDALASLHAVPPLAEQKRIVAKVDELMALCDELEEKQQRKATVTTKLRGSAFNALRQAETPDDLVAAWERISTNWSHLTNHPDTIPELRKTILDLAVKGRIAPEGLSWNCDSVALSEIAHVQSGFTFASGDFNQSRAGLPVIRIGDIGNSDADRYFDGEYRDEFLVFTSDLLIGMSGNFNVRRWAGSTALLNQRVAKLVIDESRANLDFIMWDLQQQLDLLHETHSFTTVPNLSMKMIKNLELRLPPIDVQEQIVTMADQMLAMCDELGKQLQHQQDLSSRLGVAATFRETPNAA